MADSKAQKDKMKKAKQKAAQKKLVAAECPAEIEAELEDVKSYYDSYEDAEALIYLQSLSKNKLFISHLRIEPEGIVQIKASDLKDKRINRAIELRLVEIVSE
jgi:Cdc6-like AAA superfamily ATPase